MGATNERIEQAAEKTGELNRALGNRETNTLAILGRHRRVPVVFIAQQKIAFAVKPLFVGKTALEDHGVFVAEMGVRSGASRRA